MGLRDFSSRGLAGLLALALTLAAAFMPALSAAGAGGLFEIVGSSFASRTGGNVYPGSRYANLTVEAVYGGYSNALNVHACVNLPQGFSPAVTSCSVARGYNGTSLEVVSPGMLISFSFLVNVDKGVQPGAYNATLNITYYLAGAGLASELHNVTLNVSPYPPLEVRVVDSYFSPFSFPGAYPVSLNVELENDGNSTISGATVTLELNGPFVVGGNARATVQGLAENARTLITFNNIMVAASAVPGTYVGVLRFDALMATDDGVAYNASGTATFAVSVGSPPSLLLRVLDYGLTSNLALPGLRGTGLRVALMSLNNETIDYVNVYARLSGGAFENGSGAAFFNFNGPYRYGDVFTITIGGIDVNADASYLRADLEIVARTSYQGTVYWRSCELAIVVQLQRRPLDIEIVGAYWNGDAYPGSTGNTLYVDIYNGEASSLTAVTATLRLPPGFNPSTISVRAQDVQQRSTARLAFGGIDISASVEPGLYNFTLVLDCVLVNNDRSTTRLTISMPVRVAVRDPRELSGFQPALFVASAYWGQGSPSYVYAGDPRAPLTVVIGNGGPRDVAGVVASLLPLASDLQVLGENATCPGVLPAGGFCTITFFVNASRAVPGVKDFKVLLSYEVPSLGTYTSFSVAQGFSLYLPPAEIGTGISVVSYGWNNDYPAYPGERGAVLVVTLANTLPYTVSSLWATLSLPSGMEEMDGHGVFYVQGPLASSSSTTLTFVVNLARELRPGIHAANLTVSYYVESGGGGYRVVQLYQLALNVSDPSKAFEVVAYGWLGGQPHEGQRGAQYYVVLRNDELPNIRGIVARLALPEGLVDASTNESEAIGYTTTFQAYAPNVAEELINVLLGGQAIYQQQAAGKGDFIALVFRLNVLRAFVGRVQAPLRLSFVDHWGYVYEVDASVPIVMEPQPPLIDVALGSPLVVFRNGTATLEVVLMNHYQYPVYDVFVMLQPVSPVGVPLGNVRYVGELPASSSAAVAFLLVYNPQQAVGVQGLALSQGSATFVATIVYRDSSGYTTMLNQTLAAMVKPFIQLALSSDTTARFDGNRVTVSGTVYNIGISNARSVMVVLHACGANSTSFLGDVSSASQMAFSVSVPCTSRVATATLILKYLDDYNVAYEDTYTLNVTTITTSTAPSLAPSQGGASQWYAAIVVIVAAFLAGTFYVVYRHTKGMGLQQLEGQQ
ncbi:MAG: hypothetical protein ABWK00_05625 [Desulfurococcaceae archaeon]